MGKSAEKSPNPQEDGAIKKPLEFVMPDSVLNRFANYTVVQHESDAFTLSFFEIQKPPILGSEEERMKAAKALPAVPAVCVARIVVTPSHFKNLLDAMQANFEKHQKGQGGADTP